MDQDAFNVVFGRKIVLLGAEYDFMLHLISYRNEGYSLDQLISFYDMKHYETLDDLFDNVVHKQ